MIECYSIFVNRRVRLNARYLVFKELPPRHDAGGKKILPENNWQTIKIRFKTVMSS